MVIRIGEGSAAPDRDEARVADLGQDHRLTMSSACHDAATVRKELPGRRIRSSPAVVAAVGRRTGVRLNRHTSERHILRVTSIDGIGVHQHHRGAAGRSLRLAQPAGSIRAAVTAVATDAAQDRGSLTARRPRRVGPARWPALGGRASGRRLRPATAFRRQGRPRRSGLTACGLGDALEPHSRLRSRRRRPHPDGRPRRDTGSRTFPAPDVRLPSSSARRRPRVTSARPLARSGTADRRRHRSIRTGRFGVDRLPDHRRAPGRPARPPRAGQNR